MSTNKIIMRAIQLIRPNAQVSIVNDDINSIDWHNNETPIPNAEIEAKYSEAETQLNNEAQNKIDLKASAKAKLIAGEKLTEEEANVLVGV